MPNREKTIRILLVDDETEFRDAAGQALRRQGFQVSEAGSGEHALELLPGDRPDLVILDLKMGGMDGIATLTEIRKIDPDLPVLILTGHGRYEHALAGIQMGVVDFVQKPVDLKVLGVRIGELVRGGKRPLREKRLEELMVPEALYRRILIDLTVRDAVLALQEAQRRELMPEDTDRGRRTLLVFDGKAEFKGLVRAEDIVRLTVPSFLVESPYSSYFTGMFLAQAKVVGRLPLREVLKTPPTLDVDAPLMEAAYWLVSRRLSHLPILRDGKLVGILRPEDLYREIAGLSVPEEREEPEEEEGSGD
jgi:DNA-binding response OmpR family regulator